MSKIIVSDTGPLIALAIVELLPKLDQIFEAVHVPAIVYEEAVIDLIKPGAQIIKNVASSSWFKVEKTAPLDEFEALKDLLDPGEAAAIALAKQLKTILLIDERKGRRVAGHYNILVTGTAAILIKAKQQKLISKVQPLLQKLIVHGYRFSSKLIHDILEYCDENIDL